MIRVIRDDWTPFVKEVGKIPVTLIQIVPRTMRDIIRMWVGKAQGLTKLLGLIKTGYYLDAHKYSSGRVEKRGKSWIGYFGNDAHYAGYLEEGTRAHGPIHAKYLVWRGDMGKLIFAKWVRGIKPYRIWGKTLENSDMIVNDIIDRNIKKELEMIDKRALRGRTTTYNV